MGMVLSVVINKSTLTHAESLIPLGAVCAASTMYFTVYAIFSNGVCVVHQINRRVSKIEDSFCTFSEFIAITGKEHWYRNGAI